MSLPARAAADGPQHLGEAQRPERDDGQAPVEGRLGREVERAVAEVGVRVRVEDDREVAVVDGRPSAGHGEAGLGSGRSGGTRS